jgi:hypothetical protein
MHVEQGCQIATSWCCSRRRTSNWRRGFRRACVPAKANDLLDAVSPLTGSQENRTHGLKGGSWKRAGVNRPHRAIIYQ